MANLLDQALQGHPIIDGDRVTFIWSGDRAPQLIGDVTGWQWGSPIDLAQVAPGVWAHTLTLPQDAYLEYAFWDGQQRVADPLNRNTTPDGLGNENHYFYMPGAAPTTLTRRRRNVPHGTITRHVLENGFLLAGKRRTVLLYHPPTAEPCPLLVVLDGQDYRRRARITTIVDNLIAEGRIPPIALALPYHGGGARGVEYACSEATLVFLLDEVLALAREELNLVDVQDNPGAYGILGASMGGLMALYAGLRAPEVFGRVLSQSGAFAMTEHTSVVFDLVRHGPVSPLRVWMCAGRYEWLLDCNRRMHELLAERGYDVVYDEYGGGHNYPSWRDRLGRGVEMLFCG
jgi:enterochelin esterase family protein